jgi:hypothetical protein
VTKTELIIQLFKIAIGVAKAAQAKALTADEARAGLPLISHGCQNCCDTSIRSNAVTSCVSCR